MTPVMSPPSPDARRPAPTADWVAARVQERRLWTPGLVSLIVASPIGPFLPGQFLKLGVTVDGRRQSRPYSIASAPGAPLEFIIREVPEGLVSPVLAGLQPGESVDVHTRPVGVFTLARVPRARTLWLFATGTGLAPYLSLLRAGALWDRFERVILVHGVRAIEEATHAAELDRCAGSHPLAVIRAVSRGPVSGGILAGRITTALSDGALEARADLELTPADSAAMICGNPAMVSELSTLLEQRGLRRHSARAPGHFVIERYW